MVKIEVPLSNYAASYLQIMFNGPRINWKNGAKMIIIEVPLNLAYEKKCFVIVLFLYFMYDKCPTAESLGFDKTLSESSK